MLPEKANDNTRNPSAENVHRFARSVRRKNELGGDVPANDSRREFRDAGDANRCDETSDDDI